MQAPVILAASDGPNWSRFLVVVGAFAVVIAVRELIVKLIHPHRRDEDTDDRGPGESNPDGDAP